MRGSLPRIGIPFSGKIIIASFDGGSISSYGALILPARRTRACR